VIIPSSRCTRLGGYSGVNIRTIQQYEGRSKDINKAAGATLRSLAQVLSCRIEDLLEYNSV
jgi:DNA-binding Xre family transcriptional regulator